MTALSIPAALTLALHCAPAEDPGMLVAIARQESGLETMTLHDDPSGQVLRGAGVVEMARRLIAAGHSVDLGAWQINSRNWRCWVWASPMRSSRAKPWRPPPG